MTLISPLQSVRFASGNGQFGPLFPHETPVQVGAMARLMNAFSPANLYVFSEDAPTEPVSPKDAGRRLDRIASGHDHMLLPGKSGGAIRYDWFA